MLWIRELEQPIDDQDSFSTSEIEFASDSHIPGVLEYGDRRIVCQMSTFEPDHLGMYRYTLVLSRPKFDVGDYLGGEATTSGYFFSGGPGAELLALFSIFLRARLFPISIVSERAAGGRVPLKYYFDDNRTRFTRGRDSHFPRNFAVGLDSFLDRIRSIPGKQHPNIALSVHNYSEALRLLGRDEELVFIRLVTAVETLSSKFKLRKEDDPFAGSSFDEYVNIERLTTEQTQELRNTFNVRKSRLRFRRFMEQWCVSEIPENDDRPAHVALTRTNLAATLDAIYRARSGYLHRSAPMYTSHPIMDHPEWDFSPDLGKKHDRRYFDPKDKLPHAHVFERLVRTALLEYMTSIA